MTRHSDPYAAAGPETDGRYLRVTLASGTTARLECTVPLEGVLRLRLADRPGPRPDSPVLVDAPHRPARLRTTGQGVEITGPGVRAYWDRGVRQGFHFGSYHRFSEPEEAIGYFRSGYRPATRHHRSASWVETIHLNPGAAVYGGGESYQGIDLRGRRRSLRNKEENRAAGRDTAYLNVPLLWSDAGWGLFAHTGGPVDADLGATHSEAARIEIHGEDLDLFLISGDAPTILDRYLTLTGRPHPLPDWAFGVWMSRSSYFTAEEMVATVDELRAADCPVDVIHADEWLAGNVLEAAAWTYGPDRRRFPQDWARELARRGVRTSLWINPYVTRGTPLADELIRRGYLVRDPDGAPAPTADNPDSLVVDFTHPEARAWWCERLAATLREEHNSAVLADFGEEIPDDAVFADGSRGSQRRNAYGLLYQNVVREAGLRARAGDFTAIARSGTAGSQRYPAHWAGDMPSSWSGLATTLRAVLSMALSGCSVVTHDAGGYYTPDSYAQAAVVRRKMTPGEVPTDVEPELYARWAQWAAFSPIMRFHGMGRREPTAYPEPFRSAAVAACRLRRRLAPYVAACAARATVDGGLPLLRPMPLAFPGDRCARDAQLQYLLGPDVLVAPLLEPGGRRELYVPAGEWRQLLGDGVLTGPGWQEVRCAPEEFPGYARAGREIGL
ncbi:glycoside hydrolase family 31 protein [Streptomyces sp. AA0539]|uniref:glycoside hydrolase family 31 protein n=1 Tax=Streptomyces sp. AA0539 TaxID=1210045 RepID=UPI0002D4534A|nr:TIM-barrel domain-containing protein [Streptomyces sp. AA0539]